MLFKTFYRICFAVMALIYLNSCASLKSYERSKIELELLDEYIIAKDAKFNTEPIGGLSGIDYRDGYFYWVVDVPSNPRIYKTTIEFDAEKIKQINFIETVKITTDNTDLWFDLESVLVHPNQPGFLVSSEGSIKNKKQSGIYQIDEQGKIQKTYSLPDYVDVNKGNQAHHNGVWESLCFTPDQSQFFTALELPASPWGKPKLYDSPALVSVLRYDLAAENYQKKYFYPLERIRTWPLKPFAINGLTAMLAFDESRYIMLERAYSAGRGNKANRAILFEYEFADLNSDQNLKQLNREAKTHKKLILDLKKIRKSLASKRLDNLEGMCFGPTLPNGNPTLLLIADNNFNSFDEQINQVLWFEIKKH